MSNTYEFPGATPTLYILPNNTRALLLANIKPYQLSVQTDDFNHLLYKDHGGSYHEIPTYDVANWTADRIVFTGANRLLKTSSVTLSSLTTLTGAGDASSLHHHNSLYALAGHNHNHDDLALLNNGNTSYRHLDKLTQYDVLTGGVDANALHTHAHTFGSHSDITLPGADGLEYFLKRNVAGVWFGYQPAGGLVSGWSSHYWHSVSANSGKLFDDYLDQAVKTTSNPYFVSVKAYNATGYGTYIGLTKAAGSWPDSPTLNMPVLKTDYTAMYFSTNEKRVAHFEYSATNGGVLRLYDIASPAVAKTQISGVGESWFNSNVLVGGTYWNGWRLQVNALDTSAGFVVLGRNGATDVAMLVTSSGYSAKHFIIKGDGKVGIGIDTPTDTLDVTGGITLSTTLTWKNGIKAVSQWSDSLQFKSAANTNLFQILGHPVLGVAYIGPYNNDGPYSMLHIKTRDDTYGRYAIRCYSHTVNRSFFTVDCSDDESGRLVLEGSLGYLYLYANKHSEFPAGIRLPQYGAGTVLSDAYGKLYVGSGSTPAAHKTTHYTSGSDALTPADIGASASTHNHTGQALVCASFRVTSLGAGTVLCDASGNFSVGSAQAPGAHASTHKGGGADALLPADASGWLKNNGSGTYSWTTPTYTEVGAAASGHDHAGVYSPTAHDHNSVYSPIAHAINGASYGYGDRTNAGHLRVGLEYESGLLVSSGTVSVDFGTAYYQACRGNDTRLYDAREPSSHILVDASKHTVSGLTTGHVLKATSPTSFAFSSLSYSDVGAAAATHASQHNSGGADQLSVTNLAGWSSYINQAVKTDSAVSFAEMGMNKMVFPMLEDIDMSGGNRSFTPTSYSRCRMVNSGVTYRLTLLVGTLVGGVCVVILNGTSTNQTLRFNRPDGTQYDATINPGFGYMLIRSESGYYLTGY
jgi:hypothetical protein